MAETLRRWTFNQGLLYKNWEVENNDAYLADHAKLQDADGKWHLFGIKKMDADSGYGERLTHFSTWDFKNWYAHPDVLFATGVDAAGESAPNWYSLTPSFIFAPSGIENPNWDPDGTAVTDKRYVLCCTLVNDPTPQHSEWLAFAYSDDMSSWYWDTATNPFNIEAHNEDGTGDFWWKPLSHYSAYRDARFFHDEDSGKYYMTFMCYQYPGTWQGAAGLIEWTTTSGTFTQGWTIHANKYLIDYATINPEGPGIIKSGSHYYVWTHAYMWRIDDIGADTPCVGGNEDWDLVSSILSDSSLGYANEIDYDSTLDEWIATSHDGRGGSYAKYYKVGSIEFSDTLDPVVTNWFEPIDGSMGLISEWSVVSGSVFDYQPVIFDAGDPYRFPPGSSSPWPRGTRCTFSSVWSGTLPAGIYEFKAIVDHVVSPATEPPASFSGSDIRNDYWEFVSAIPESWVEDWSALSQGSLASGYNASGWPGTNFPEAPASSGPIDNSFINTGGYAPNIWETVSFGPDYCQLVGRIVSDTFVVTGSRMKVRVGGAGDETCYVAMYAGSGQLLFKEYGTGSPWMTVRYWDTSSLVGSSAYFAINDGDTHPDTGFICCGPFEAYDLSSGESDPVAPTSPLVASSGIEHFWEEIYTRIGATASQVTPGRLSRLLDEAQREIVQILGGGEIPELEVRHTETIKITDTTVEAEGGLTKIKLFGPDGLFWTDGSYIDTGTEVYHEFFDIVAVSFAADEDTAANSLKYAKGVKQLEIEQRATGWRRNFYEEIADEGYVWSRAGDHLYIYPAGELDPDASDNLRLTMVQYPERFIGSDGRIKSAFVNASGQCELPPRYWPIMVDHVVRQITSSKAGGPEVSLREAMMTYQAAKEDAND
jgi:hypothetical protein